MEETSALASTWANRETCMLFTHTVTAVVIRQCVLSHLHLICFCPAFQVKCLRSNMVTRPAVEWPPLMDQYLIDLGYFTLSLTLCLPLLLSLQQRWRELSGLSGVLNQSRPLYGLARGGLGGGLKGGPQAAIRFKGVITSRSWPLSSPVEPTAFDCLLVLLYLPGVIRLNWHMLKTVSFDNQAGEWGGCWARAQQNI